MPFSILPFLSKATFFGLYKHIVDVKFLDSGFCDETKAYCHRCP